MDKIPDLHSPVSRPSPRQAVGPGYTNVFIMPGGLSGWVAAKKPLEKRIEGT